MVRVRGKNWVVTINNPSSECAQFLSDPLSDERVKFCVFQAEAAPGTGTLHYQLYLQTHQRCDVGRVKDILRSPGAHIEKRRGNHQQAVDYCSKDESRFVGVLAEHFPRCGSFGEGDASGQGKRSDLDDLKASIDAGASDCQLFDDHFGPMLRYHRGVQIYKRLKLEKRRQQTECIVLYGGTGVGKSYRANHLYPGAFHLRRPNGGPLWWDGYAGEESVIVDEFEGWMTQNFFKLLIDENPLQIAIKGSHLEFCARRVIFISNKDPRHWWTRTCGSLPGPIVRRLTAPIGACYHVFRRQEDVSDIACGAELVDVSVPIEVEHVQ